MLTKTIPSMFIRRLLLLGSLIALGVVLPSVQILYLTVARGEELRQDAESKLVLERWVDTTRGRILDRKGRVLAMDRPSYDIAVDYPVITGDWARRQAVRAATRRHRQRWPELSEAEREALIEEELPVYQAQLEAMWTRFAFTAGVPLEQVQERRREIQREVEAAADAIWERQYLRLRERLERQGRLPEEPEAIAALRRKVEKPTREMVTAHVVLRAVDDRTAFAFKRLVPPPKGSPPPDPSAPEPMPGLHVVDSRTREYPFASIDLSVDRSTFPGTLKADGTMPVRVEGVATHIIGWMRSKVYAEDIKARPKYIVGPDGKPTGEIDRGHYQVGDSVGAAGLERTLERELRGLRGLHREHLDTGEEEETPAQPGRDIPLTIDIMLQARIQALFDPALGLAVKQPWHRNTEDNIPVGAAYAGAAVVIDVDTGDILALVSAPSFTHEQLQKNPDWVFKEPLLTPAVNRAINRPYQPGSIVKPLIYVGAVASGKIPLGGRISCTGRFYEDQPDAYRCWIYKLNPGVTHDMRFGHAPDASEAIMVSCNIFFYELGRRLGGQGVTEWFTKFGVGPKADLPRIDLGDFTGPDGRAQIFPGALGLIGKENARLSTRDAVLMGIGQGPIAWTPLHAADAYATLARMGLRIVPRLRLDEPQREHDLGLNPAAVAEALEGLRGSVSDRRGTGHHITVADPTNPDRTIDEPTFNVKGITVWGKTGTADASKLVGKDGQGNVVERDGDPSWTVVLCGPSSEARPRYAIAVVVEYGGSGGRVAGPIANQVIHALIAEGYLPGAAPGSEGGVAGTPRGDGRGDAGPSA
jgi:penicillin-binding protein 2